MRDVLLGADPAAKLTERATGRLATTRAEHADIVHSGGNLIVQNRSGESSWWTWAGFRANATLAATLSEITDPMQRFDDQRVRLRAEVTPQEWRDATTDAAERLCLPSPSEKALVGLKFSDALPKRLAMSTLAARVADLDGAAFRA
jgi:ATP-dependent helicase Lhr and Lhr-like helicase